MKILNNPVKEILEEMRNNGVQKISLKEHEEAVKRTEKAMKEFRFKEAMRESRMGSDTTIVTLIWKE